MVVRSEGRSFDPDLHVFGFVGCEAGLVCAVELAFRLNCIEARRFELPGLLVLRCRF